MQVEVELVGPAHDLEALGVGLHESVLDPVVDHLDEVPGADRADVGVAALGGERQQGGLDHGHRLVRAADHEAVALGQAPHAARGAGVDEADPARRGGRRLDGLLVVGVAPVDDDVALRTGRPARRWCRWSACRPGP